jgi:hypothetical protein
MGRQVLSRPDPYVTADARRRAARTELPLSGDATDAFALKTTEGQLRIRGNQAAGRAETILLVGGAGSSPWGFAATLRAALTDALPGVHVGPMSGFAPGTLHPGRSDDRARRDLRLIPAPSDQNPCAKLVGRST